MREYARISPRFWIGDTGRKIRERGAPCQLVALYLLTSPHSNMIGMYWLPIAYIANEVGLTLQGAEKALQSLIEVDFCAYDQHTEVVWVKEMAKFQIAERLSAKDKQAKGVQNAYDDVPANPFLADFFQAHADAFCMTHARVYEGPSKLLGSKAQEKAKAQAHAQAPHADEIAIAIPIVGGEEYQVTRTQVQEWTKLYPAVDVLQELRKMVGWCQASPERQKTSKGIVKFIVGWLGRAQDAGGASPPQLTGAPRLQVVGGSGATPGKTAADKNAAVISGILNVGERDEPPGDYIDVDAIRR